MHIYRSFMHIYSTTSFIKFSFSSNLGTVNRTGYGQGSVSVFEVYLERPSDFKAFPNIFMLYSSSEFKALIHLF